MKVFISDVALDNRQEIQSVIVNDLRYLGVKQRVKKPTTKHIQGKHCASKKLFKTPLHCLPLEQAELCCGTTAEVPLFVLEICSFIYQHAETEGLFRKAGSSARQRELKSYLESGKKVGQQNHVIDVANILKLFFRELPEPLLPFSYHEILMRCLLLKENKVHGILLTCLLFPTVHLNTLAYLMGFLQKIATHSETNKMDVTNLAIIITPSVMPAGVKVSQKSMRLAHHIQVIELLIKNAHKIGIVPETVVEKVTFHVDHSNDEPDTDVSRQSKKHKRNASLTRMLNGLKKMVGKGSPEAEENHLISSTPDFSTPLVKSTKKRKAVDLSSPFPIKKKRDVLQALPQELPLASTFSTTYKYGFATPVCSHPNPDIKSNHLSYWNVQHRKSFTQQFSESTTTKESSMTTQEKKQKCTEGIDATQVSYEISDESLEARRSRSSWCMKKRLNLSDAHVKYPSNDDLFGEHVQAENLFTSIGEANVNLSDIEMDNLPPSNAHSCESEFVRIPKSEYESIKSRVCAIENKISEEFNNIVSAKEKDSRYLSSLHFPSSDSNSNTELVQSAYERTLEESEKLDDPATDQLAKRLSKELKIRRSLEHKVIRSPSARKIGTIKRRSKEGAKPMIKKSPEGEDFARNNTVLNSPRFFPRSTLRRGRPNTVLSGLPYPRMDSSLSTELYYNLHCQHNIPKSSKMPGSLGAQTPTNSEPNCSNDSNRSDCTMTRSRTRSASFQENLFEKLCSKGLHKDLRSSCSFSDLSETPHLWSLKNRNTSSKKNATPKKQIWQSADVFFNSDGIKQASADTRRASVAKLHSQNAGIVRERMKLFDAMLNETRKANMMAKTEGVVHSPRGSPVCSALVVKSHEVNIHQEASRESPKKIGSPRRKMNPSKSPKCDYLKLNGKANPNRRLRKNGNVKLVAEAPHISSKASTSTTPVKWLWNDRKENISSGNGREECSPQPLKHLSSSPFKDSNRNATASPYRTPYIKKPLLTKNAGHFSRTPQSGLKSTSKNRRNNTTPMKALIDFSSSGRSVASPQRQNPHQVLLKSWNIA